MDLRIIMVVCVALGMFVGRFLLPRKVDGVLIVDDYDQVNPKWYIKMYNDREILLIGKHVYLDVARRIQEGDVQWPREKS